MQLRARSVIDLEIAAEWNVCKKMNISSTPRPSEINGATCQLIYVVGMPKRAIKPNQAPVARQRNVIPRAHTNIREWIKINGEHIERLPTNELARIPTKK